MHLALVAALFLPLVGFVLLMGSSFYIHRKLAGWIGCGTILVSFVLFLGVMIQHLNTGQHPESYTLFQWLPIKGIDANFTLAIDALSLLMTLIISGVGSLIHIYSIGYMSHDASYARYFACMNFFVFSMLLLVLAGHLLLLFVGWEGVGLASYLLIGFWYERPAAAQAATKAFVINRIGDLGLLLGLLLTFQLFGTGDIYEILSKAESGFLTGAPIITVLTLLYFTGSVGKSAQLPLYTWLPDAMEGPTPVSALIHAATMVTAGVFLIVRMHPLFLMAPLTMNVIGIVGGVTALFAALCAVGQTDLKRVLAFSTVSQLGYMFLACGVGAFYAAMFHLTTHAFVKALLFLSAGNVIHMTHDNTDMRKMGGLGKYFPKTRWLFLIGVLALSGVPPLSAFFSKDLILEEEAHAGLHLLFFIGLITSIITAYYLTRAHFLTFKGMARADETDLSQVKEAPAVMLTPVAILAVLAVFGGFLGFCFCTDPILATFLSEVDVQIPVEEFSVKFLLAPETLLSISGAILGVGLAAFIYSRYVDATIPLLKHSFYINEIYWNVFAVPLRALANMITGVLEPKFFNGMIHFVVKGTQHTAGALQRIQSGQIRSYVAWLLIGAFFMIAFFIY